MSWADAAAALFSATPLGTVAACWDALPAADIAAAVLSFPLPAPALLLLLLLPLLPAPLLAAGTTLTLPASSPKPRDGPR